ncbi:hypothetical protein JCM19238_3321 [Vibrio ponticus]|nr:hypothetical protein JCM19238_3321 [Vibrio ponticus]
MGKDFYIDAELESLIPVIPAKAGSSFNIPNILTDEKRDSPLQGNDKIKQGANKKSQQWDAAGKVLGF